MNCRLVSVLAAALVVRGVDGTMRHSLHKTTSEILFVPLPAGRAKSLVDLARAEKDPSLKRDIVSKLSVMKAPEATDYMLELLK